MKQRQPIDSVFCSIAERKRRKYAYTAFETTDFDLSPFLPLSPPHLVPVESIFELRMVLLTSRASYLPHHRLRARYFELRVRSLLAVA